MDRILHYFPGLSSRQTGQLAQLDSLYRSWNQRINVISRKDIDNLLLHHVLHSLSIARLVSFNPGAAVLDAGTGGGMPGIPLAILFPEARFLLADSIGKKISVVQAVATELGLSNVTGRQCRVEEVTDQFDYVVSRAVTTFPVFHSWVGKLIRPGSAGTLANGILYLKGGDLEDELKPFAGRATVHDIAQWFTEPFFETKKIIYLPVF